METYRTVEMLKDPLVLVRDVDNIMNGDLCRVKIDSKEILGQVITAKGRDALIEVFSSISGFNKVDTQVTFEGKLFSTGVTEHILGRVFDGLGNPIDGSEIVPEKFVQIYGNPINPAIRESPSDFIQTGISAIDGLNSLVMGQKLPIFSGSGLPGDDIAIQVVKNAKTLKGNKFAILFGAMGITDREVDKFMGLFDSANADRTSLFINRASDSIIERISLPKVVLTNAEYLAFEKGYDVLVVLTDMLSYSDALRQLSSERKQIPGRRGYPSSLYNDLAIVYERCGKIRGINGSITIIPVLTMPSDDITHPVPDLSGYITEGQVVLSRDLFNRKIFPPINLQGSLSRLMDNGIGKGFTREDHRQVANQLYLAFSKGTEARNLSLLIGEGGLSEEDKLYLSFLDEFEKKFINQKVSEDRDIKETLTIAWSLLKTLPSLPRIDKTLVEKYMH
jgi:V/A-type H+-transporting ATPase subunit B